MGLVSSALRAKERQAGHKPLVYSAHTTPRQCQRRLFFDCSPIVLRLFFDFESENNRTSIGHQSKNRRRTGAPDHRAAPPGQARQPAPGAGNSARTAKLRFRIADTDGRGSPPKQLSPWAPWALYGALLPPCPPSRPCACLCATAGQGAERAVPAIPARRSSAPPGSPEDSIVYTKDSALYYKDGVSIWLSLRPE